MEQTRQLWEESEEQSPASWLVCVTDRPLPHRLDRLTASAEELSKATGKTCLAAQADVRHPEQLRDAVAKTIEKFGRIDFVICGQWRTRKATRRLLRAMTD